MNDPILSPLNGALPLDTYFAKRSKLGRPTELPNRLLRSERDLLYDSLCRQWHHVGLILEKLRDPANRDFHKAVAMIHREWKVLEKDCEVQLERLFLVRTPAELSSQDIRTRQKELTKQRFRIQKLQGQQSEDRAWLKRLDSSSVADQDREIVDSERADVMGRIATTQLDIEESQSLANAENELLKQARSYFARNQLIEFCRNKHYSLQPLNVANALAGAPWVRWRTSMTRCIHFKVPKSDIEGAYGTFLEIRRIVRSLPETGSIDSLEAHAENWLRKRTKTSSQIIFDLAKNWYYLKRSIETLRKEKSLRREWPFRVAARYQELLQAPRDLDLLLAGRKQIDCRKIKKRRKKITSPPADSGGAPGSLTEV